MWTELRYTVHPGDPMKLHSFPMWLLALSSLFFATTSIAQTAPAPPAVSRQLVAIYKPLLENKVLTLCNPYIFTAQSFDEQGSLTSHSPTGPWTLYGRMLVQKVSANQKEFKLEGKRVWVKFDGDKMENILSNPPVDMEIDIRLANGTDAMQQANAAMKKVLLSSGENMSDIVPDYWKRYFERVEGRLPPRSFRDQSRVQWKKLKSTGKPVPLISQGLSQGTLIHEVRPIYPIEAKIARASGTVELTAVIGKDGRVQSLSVDKAVGVGLEEAAIDAVKQWRYKPYYFNGAAVDVETKITLNFRL